MDCIPIKHLAISRFKHLLYSHKQAVIEEIKNQKAALEKTKQRTGSLIIDMVHRKSETLEYCLSVNLENKELKENLIKIDEELLRLIEMNLNTI